MTRITPSLWFDGNAEEAAGFYAAIFPNSRIDKVYRAPVDTSVSRKGDVVSVQFTLDGNRFVGINGGPEFGFNEAVSFAIECKDQAEVDRYWEALLQRGGTPSVCGWLKDRYGLSWQVIPRQLDEMLDSDDQQAAGRAMEAMLKMEKIDVAKLRGAYESVPA